MKTVTFTFTIEDFDSAADLAYHMREFFSELDKDIGNDEALSRANDLLEVAQTNQAALVGFEVR